MAFPVDGSYLVILLHAVIYDLVIYSGTLMYENSHLQNGLDITIVMHPLGRY